MGEVMKLFPGEVESHGDGNQLVFLADCFHVMEALPENSISAVVTDPPYGVKEYDEDQIEKMNAGVGGIWRIPPAIGGHVRSPLPRFTALNEQERARVAEFFEKWAIAVHRVLAPGGHIFMASNAFLSQVVFSAIVKSGLEFRGEVVRVVRTLRGGDRPKNAETEFPDVCSMPRGCYEPWGLFRKPLEGTVAQNLRKWGTGGLRRFKSGNPFCDLVPSERTPAAERELCDHPSLKPQSLMRLLVYASLPLGKGIVLDPFAGSGSTVAAAKRLGYSALGVERSREYFGKSKLAVDRLAQVRCAEPFLDARTQAVDEGARSEEEGQLRLVSVIPIPPKQTRRRKGS